MNCLSHKAYSCFLPVENLWKSWEKPIARPFGYKNCLGRSSHVFHKIRANFPQVFPQARFSVMGNGESGRTTVNSDCRVRQPAEYFDSRVRIFPADAPYAMSECVKRGSSFATDNVNSIAQLTQSLGQSRICVPQLSDFVATVKHSRVVLSAEHFANFWQTQSSMLSD